MLETKNSGSIYPWDGAYALFSMPFESLIPPQLWQTRLSATKSMLCWPA